jgi:hypothetical protein
MLDFRVATHPADTVLAVVVETSALQFAEDGVRRLTEAVLQRSGLLATWRIVRCEMRLAEEDPLADLAADESDAGDPAERAAPHALTPGAPVAQLSEKEIAEQRAALLAESSRLHAFDLQD